MANYQHVEFDFAGEHYSLDWPCIDVLEAMAIKQHTGHGVTSFIRSLEDADPHSAQALMWLCKKRMGNKVSMGGLNFDIGEFLLAFGEGIQEQVAPAVVDPTKAGENTPA